MRIATYLDDGGYAQCFKNLMPLMEVEVVEAGAKPDLAVVSASLFGKLDWMECPIILLDQIDGAQLGMARRHIERPDVVAIIKGYRMREPEDNNITKGRMHMRHMGGVARPTSLSLSDLEKIQLGPNFAHFRPALQTAAAGYPDLDPGDRPIDVIFMGTMPDPHNDRETDAGLLHWHRHACQTAIAELPKAFATVVARGRPYRHPKYLAQMRMSKIAVSPYGWGEFCHRDYEALLCGCHVVKPECAWVESLGQIAAHVEYCRPDWQDLTAVVERIVDDWGGDYSIGQRQAAVVAMRGVQRLESVAKHVFGVLSDGYNAALRQ